MLTFGSLFSGIGGIDLGLERAGLVCKWQVEIDEYARRVLAKHWPKVLRWEDVRTFPPSCGEQGCTTCFEPWKVDLICGGFPCQDISNAGTVQTGLEGERSGLWFEFARIIRLVRPAFVLVENVPALLARGMGRVLGDLAASGYDAEWDCLPAGAFGAPHERDRLFIVAYPAVHERRPERSRGRRMDQRDDGLQGRPQDAGGNRELRAEVSIADADRKHSQARIFGPGGKRAFVPRPCWGTDKPGVDRTLNGVPRRVDRCNGLGNAVVPQVAEWIGRRLLESIGGRG